MAKTALCAEPLESPKRAPTWNKGATGAFAEAGPGGGGMVTLLANPRADGNHKHGHNRRNVQDVRPDCAQGSELK
jgi:hypothetical protein